MDEKDDEIWYRITFKGKLALLLIDIKDFFRKRFSRTKDEE